MSKPITPMEIKSSYPHCGVRKLKDKRRWYGWLRSILSIQDLMRPDFPRYWRSLTRAQKNRIREYVGEYFEPGDWEKLKEWMNGQRRNARLKERLRDSWGKSDFVLTVNERLSDHTSVVVVAPQEGLNSVILFLRKMEWTPETIADLTGVDKSYIERIATPEAVANCDAAKLEERVRGILEWRTLAFLHLAVDSESLSVKEQISLLNLCHRLR